MNMVDNNEMNLNYEVRGTESRGTLVFIHGSGGDCSKWKHQLLHLPLGFKGLALDLPGHGRSSGPCCSSIEKAALILKQFIETIKTARPVILAGHSMGAAIVLQTAYEYPQIPDGIILIGGGARLKVMPGLLAELGQGKKDLGFINLCFASSTDRSLVEQEFEVFSRVDASVLLKDFNLCNNFDLSRKLNQIKIPTLIIVGEEDKMTPPKLSRYLHSEITGSQLEIIPGAGHYVMKEKPAQVTLLINKFGALF